MACKYSNTPPQTVKHNKGENEHKKTENNRHNQWEGKGRKEDK